MNGLRHNIINIASASKLFIFPDYSYGLHLLQCPLKQKYIAFQLLYAQYRIKIIIVIKISSTGRLVSQKAIFFDSIRLSFFRFTRCRAAMCVKFLWGIRRLMSFPVTELKAHAVSLLQYSDVIVSISIGSAWEDTQAYVYDRITEFV